MCERAFEVSEVTAGSGSDSVTQPWTGPIHGAQERVASPGEGGLLGTSAARSIIRLLARDGGGMYPQAASAIEQVAVFVYAAECRLAVIDADLAHRWD